MRHLFFLVTLLIFAIEANGQDEEELFFPYESVRITNPGSLYAAVDWTPEMRAELIAEFGKEVTDGIIAGSSESAWPVGIASLDSRNTNQSLLLEYKGYYMTTVNDVMAVIVISASENQHMGEDLAPEEDIYFVILINAIEASDSDPIDWVQVFFDEMEVITSDFKNGFTNLLGEVIQEPSEDVEKIFASKVSLDGSYFLNFYQAGPSGDIFLKADFLGDIDHKSALKIYEDLSYLVEVVELSCCSLVKKEEPAKGKSRSLNFEVAAKDGFLDPDFQNMVINLSLEPREVFNPDGELEIQWEPVMYIFKK
jgi:hypothetical protein